MCIISVLTWVSPKGTSLWEWGQAAARYHSTVFASALTAEHHTDLLADVFVLASIFHESGMQQGPL